MESLDKQCRGLGGGLREAESRARAESGEDAHRVVGVSCER